ncbi:MAG: hypothetical protein ACK6EB_17905, partial [Planctomyces sp.]
LMAVRCINHVIHVFDVTHWQLLFPAIDITTMFSGFSLINTGNRDQLQFSSLGNLLVSREIPLKARLAGPDSRVSMERWIRQYGAIEVQEAGIDFAASDWFDLYQLVISIAEDNPAAALSTLTRISVGDVPNEAIAARWVLLQLRLSSELNDFSAWHKAVDWYQATPNSLQLTEKEYLIYVLRSILFRSCEQAWQMYQAIRATSVVAGGDAMADSQFDLLLASILCTAGSFTEALAVFGRVFAFPPFQSFLTLYSASAGLVLRAAFCGLKAGLGP